MALATIIDVSTTTATGAGWGAQQANSAAIATSGYKKTSGVGDSMTISWTGRCLYALIPTITTSAGSPGCSFTVNTDGVSSPGSWSCANSSVSQKTYLRDLVALERGLVDTTHTTIITRAPISGSGTTLYMDGFIAISGSKQQATAGNLTILGDSWSTGLSGGGGTGCFNPDNDWIRRLSGMLAFSTKQHITLTTNAVSGVSMCRLSAGTTNCGIDQLMQVLGIATNGLTAAGGNPQFLALMFGANDLRASQGGRSSNDYCTTLFNMLCLIEDTMDVKGETGLAVQVAVGTPQYVNAAYTLSTIHSAGTTTGVLPSGVDMWEEAVSGTRQVVAGFSWCKLADGYAQMDRRSELLIPNSRTQPDWGLHPNDGGHIVLANEFFNAFTLPY